MRIFLAATFTALALLGLTGCGRVSERISAATGTTVEQRCGLYLLLGRALLARAERQGWDSDIWIEFSETGQDFHGAGCGPLLGEDATWPAPAVPPPDGPAVGEPAADGDAGGAEAP